MPHMTIKRSIFDVEYLADPAALPATFRVRVVMADRLHAEANGPKFGIADMKAQPQLVGCLWLYLAARREGHIEQAVTFAEFQERCLDNAKVEDEDVDPTRPGQSPGSSSPSPSAGPSSTGTPPMSGS